MINEIAPNVDSETCARLLNENNSGQERAQRNEKATEYVYQFTSVQLWSILVAMGVGMYVSRCLRLVCQKFLIRYSTTSLAQQAFCSCFIRSFI
jgi:hypothetical protein